MGKRRGHKGGGGGALRGGRGEAHRPSCPEDCVRRLQRDASGWIRWGRRPPRPRHADRHTPGPSPVPRLLRCLRGRSLRDGERRGGQGCGDGGGGGLLKGRRRAGQEVGPACGEEAKGAAVPLQPFQASGSPCSLAHPQQPVPRPTCHPTLHSAPGL